MTETQTAPTPAPSAKTARDISDALREHFPAELVGKLPRITCGACSQNKGQCGDHRKKKCDECGVYTTPKHIHIDFVGHADVTNRLLDIDPEWNWEPFATDENGMPILEHDRAGNPVGLWIKLTVGDVTRIGYGSCPSDQFEAVKVLIGDALRNAAMRFGVALNLWAKGERQDPTAENAIASGGKAARRLRKGEEPERVTDRDWMLAMFQQIQDAQNDAMLMVLEGECKTKYDSHALTVHDAKSLRAEIDKRRRMLAKATQGEGVAAGAE
ncbi:hypothetical protein [Nocardiopsis sp. FR26]|uniref:hypothetical protein n=1 Tax=Nocardiopsis sp. FR26 TaxID=2605987 RepID=UPI001356BC50|nr:hypothetical protein [Nocardiopsis sp. FR26]